MFKKYLIALTMIMLLGICGCWDKQEISDKTVITSVGIDLGGDNKVRFSDLLITPTSPEESGGSTQTTKPAIISSSADGVGMAARRTFLSFSKIPEYAHVRSLILGDNLVKNKLVLIVDFLNRNRNFSPNTNLLVSSGCRPDEVLALINNTDQVLKKLVVVNEVQLGIYEPQTVNDFTFKLLTPGIEPVVPQITIQTIKPEMKSSSLAGEKTENPSSNKKLFLNGTAVFKKDRKIGSLNEYESRGFRWLNSRTKMGGFFLIKSPFDPEAYTALEIIHFSSNTRPQVNGSKIKMQINTKAQLDFYENTSGPETITPTAVKKIEQAANQEISRQIKSCIEKSQSLNSDVLGWGLLLFQYHPDTWKQVKGNWNNVFPGIEYDIKVKTNIIHTYLSK